jgi:hypothetical protein
MRESHKSHMTYGSALQANAPHRLEKLYERKAKFYLKNIISKCVLRLTEELFGGYEMFSIQILHHQ